MATKTSGLTQPTEKHGAQPLKPAPNKAMPPKPVEPKDVEDIDRSDSEGMAQPQGLPSHPVPADQERIEPRNAPPQRSKKD